MIRAGDRGLDRGLAPRRQRVAARHGQQQPLPRHAHRLGPAAPVDRRAQQPEVDPARGQRLRLVGRHHLLQREVDLRHLGPGGRDQAREHAVARGGGEADRDRPGLAARHALRRQPGPFREVEDAARFRVEGAPRRRQPHGAAGALEQTDAEGVLQELDWRLSGGCVMLRRAAARPKCSSSATAAKQRRWLSSNIDARSGSIDAR
jgi:hypothetical protein